ncbi:hypothetical protein B0O99DRAFT_500538, partial [Bisporella sp. PMI_857]
IDVNLKSVYLTIHLILRIMEKQGADTIVNISSILGLRCIGKPQVAYSTAKVALLSFTRMTAVIYAEQNVSINTVIPRLINTPLANMPVDKSGGDYKGFVKTRNE